MGPDGMRGGRSCGIIKVACSFPSFPLTSPPANPPAPVTPPQLGAPQASRATSHTGCMVPAPPVASSHPNGCRPKPCHARLRRTLSSYGRLSLSALRQVVLPLPFGPSHQSGCRVIWGRRSGDWRIKPPVAASCCACRQPELPRACQLADRSAGLIVIRASPSPQPRRAAHSLLQAATFDGVTISSTPGQIQSATDDQPRR
jgi:hypothetical protein